MKQNVCVYFLPSLIPTGDLAAKTAVVIDVLRASTTIVQALAAGATEIVPCLEVEQARGLANELGSQVLLGGERGGQRIDGFDLGNSPGEYKRETIQGKTIAFTTTNGTKAMTACRQAGRVLIGAFVNSSALCRELAEARDVALVCAGTHGEVTREDVLCAGLLAVKICRAASSAPVVNDQARIAMDAWQAVDRSNDDLAGALRKSQGGRNLLSIGQSADVDFAAQMDSHGIVPELSLHRWRIHATILRND